MSQVSFTVNRVWAPSDNAEKLVCNAEVVVNGLHQLKGAQWSKEKQREYVDAEMTATFSKLRLAVTIDKNGKGRLVGRCVPEGDVLQRDICDSIVTFWEAEGGKFAVRAGRKASAKVA